MAQRKTAYVLMAAFASSMCSGTMTAGAGTAKTMERQMPAFSSSILKRQYHKAAELAKAAAGKGSAEALYRLATLYRLGNGAPQDLEKARDYFKQAARQGHAGARLVVKRWPAPNQPQTGKGDRLKGGLYEAGADATPYVFDPKALSPNAMSLPELAAWRGDVPSLRRLSATGVNLASKKRAGQLIAVAAAAGRANVVEMLLDKAPDQASLSEIGLAALRSAASRGHSQVVGAVVRRLPGLVDAAAADGGLLRAAVGSCDATTVSILLESGAATEEVIRDDGEVHAPVLVNAARYCGDQVVAYLVGAGVSVDVRDGMGRTALWYAAKRGRMEQARLLIAAGANPAASDASGATPLHAAAAANNLALAKALLAAGADVNAITSTGHAPLSLATGRGHVDMVRLLIASRAEVNPILAQDRTPLMLAAMIGNRELVSTLLIAGADPSLRDTHHRSAAYYAEASGHNVLAVEIANADH